MPPTIATCLATTGPTTHRTRRTDLAILHMNGLRVISTVVTVTTQPTQTTGVRKPGRRNGSDHPGLIPQAGLMNVGTPGIRERERIEDHRCRHLLAVATVPSIWQAMLLPGPAVIEGGVPSLRVDHPVRLAISSSKL